MEVHSVSPRVLRVTLLLVAAILLSGLYVALYTPVPVYILDRLNLRPFFLPNIQCRNCTHIPRAATLLSNASAACPPDTFLLNVVVSYHANLMSRNAIRETWGGVHDYHGRKIRTIFAFGVHADKNLNGQLDYEQGIHHDILQVDLHDNYRSLTYKTLLVFQWIHSYCSHVRFVLKTDDDSFNNVPRIVDYLIKERAQKFVGGYCFTVMPDRGPASKYYVPLSMYPDVYYPTYCAGPGYIMSQDAIEAILLIHQDIIFLPMEDVFIAGLCREAAGIHYTNIPGMIVGEPQLQKCDMATWAKNTHNIIPERMRVLWSRVVEADISKDCSNLYIKDYVLICIGLVLWGKILSHVFRRWRLIPPWVLQGRRVKWYWCSFVTAIILMFYNYFTTYEYSL